MIRDKVFNCYNGNSLRVITNKSNIRLELPAGELIGDDIERVFLFDSLSFNKFVDYLEKEANSIWSNFKPKEANSISSDYDEYYDREYDNNGYLSLNQSNKMITVTACWNSETRLYQFSKAKLQSFIFDCH